MMCLRQYERLLQHPKRYQIIDDKIMPFNDEDTHTKYAHTHFRSKVLYGLYVNEEILNNSVAFENAI